MKPYFIILLILLSYFIYCQDDYCGYKDEPKKASECHNLKVTGMSDFYKENEETAKYCCYFSYNVDSKDGASCVPLSEASYNDIKNVMKDIEKLYKEHDGKAKKLDCNSYYLKMSLLSLVLLFL